MKTLIVFQGYYGKKAYIAQMQSIYDNMKYIAETDYSNERDPATIKHAIEWCYWTTNSQLTVGNNAIVRVTFTSDTERYRLLAAQYGYEFIEFHLDNFNFNYIKYIDMLRGKVT